MIRRRLLPEEEPQLVGLKLLVCHLVFSLVVMGVVFSVNPTLNPFKDAVTSKRRSELLVLDGRRHQKHHKVNLNLN